jgi:Mg2+ and Co2+ transporter CorA
MFRQRKRIRELENELVELHNLLVEQERLIKELQTQLWRSRRREAVLIGKCGPIGESHGRHFT